ncbi:MAG: DUF4249 domain-containing protein [Prolixibacteraceae bacterium]|nr:DUF4249 domain-containing protein [Prolixibacteraceae bacterium]
MLFSCVREEFLDLDYSRFETKLVLFSVISPQTDSIYVALSKICSELDSIEFDSISLPTGEVILSCEENKIQLKQLSAKPAVYGCTQTEYPIERGKQYKINVTVDGYPPVTAKTTVPARFSKWHNTKQPVYGITNYPDYHSEYTFNFESEWILPEKESEQNYFAYRGKGIIYVLEPALDDTIGYRGFQYRVLDSIPYQSPLIVNEGVQSTTDKGVNMFSLLIKEDCAGYEEVITEGFEYSMTTSYTPNGRIIQYLTFYIFTVDEHFAAYKEMCGLYDSEFDGNVIRDLFFSMYKGIMPSYTNVEGGYGLFGSFGYDSVFFDVHHGYDLIKPTQEPFYAP